MNVYIPRLKAQKQAADQAAIDELEGMAAPLMLAIKAVVLVLCLYLPWQAVSGHIEDYLELAASNEALVQCINGKTIELTFGEGGSDASLRCDVREWRPIKGIGS